MTSKEFGAIRGVCVAVGDDVAYRNRHGQEMRGRVENIFVEQRGLLLVKRPEWHTAEAVDLGDEIEYPRFSIYQRERLVAYGQPELMDL